jgi:hypothetical protein
MWPPFADKVGECASQRMVRWGRDNIKVGVFAYAKDFSASAMPRSK